MNKYLLNKKFLLFEKLLFIMFIIFYFVLYTLVIARRWIMDLLGRWNWWILYCLTCTGFFHLLVKLSFLYFADIYLNCGKKNINDCNILFLHTLLIIILLKENTLFKYFIKIFKERKKIHDLIIFFFSLILTKKKLTIATANFFIYI